MTNSRSRWKPEPLTILRSGLLIISLGVWKVKGKQGSPSPHLLYSLLPSLYLSLCLSQFILLCSSLLLPIRHTCKMGGPHVPLRRSSVFCVSPAWNLPFSLPQTRPAPAPPWLLRGDLGLKEDEDEDQQCRQGRGEHHPDGKIGVQAQWVYDPAPG